MFECYLYNVNHPYLLIFLQNRKEAAGHLSRLLFVSLACGIGMFSFTWFGATPVMTGRNAVDCAEHFLEVVFE